jgi:hypothetical protein
MAAHSSQLSWVMHVGWALNTTTVLVLGGRNSKQLIPILGVGFINIGCTAQSVKHNYFQSLAENAISQVQGANVLGAKFE